MKVRRELGVLSYRLILAATLFFSILIGIGAAAVGHEEVFEDILPSYLRFTLLLLLAFMICLFIALLYRCYDSFNKRQLIISACFLFGLMAATFAVMLCNFCPVPYTDALNLQDTAMYFVKNKEYSITDSTPHRAYFGRVSNNYFLTVVYVYFFKLLARLGINDVYFPLLVLTTAGIVVTAVMMFLIGVRLKGLCGGVKILTLCVLNPIFYVLVLWVYSNVISIPFTVAVLYFGICIYQEKRKAYRILACVMEAACGIIGYFIRPTVLIPAAAFLICGVLWAIRDKERIYKLLKCAAVCAVTGGLLFQSISALNASYFSEAYEENYPVTHWLMMASHGTGKHNTADFQYTAQFATKEEKTRATTKRMLENYRKYSTSGLASFLNEKLIVSWSYGDGGDVMMKGIQNTKYTKLYSWMLGDKRDLFRLYCYAFRIATMFLIIAALCHLLGKKEIDRYQFVFVLTFFGGIFFYCFWEVKPSYAAPFIYIMLLIAMQGGDVLSETAAKAKEKWASRQDYTAVCAVLACILFVCILSYHRMANTEVARQDWSVRCMKKIPTKSITMGGEDRVITQEFSASKPWNRIGLQAWRDEEAKKANDSFRLSIVDENEKKIYDGKVTAQDVAPSGELLVKTKKVVPAGKQKYTIRISADGKQKGKMYFQQRKSRCLDTYEGSFALNGKEEVNDLQLQVFMRYKGKWCSRAAALLINGSLFLIALFLCFWLHGCGRIGKRIRKVIKNTERR